MISSSSVERNAVRVLKRSLSIFRLLGSKDRNSAFFGSRFQV